jgi:hypothetical protein
MSAFSDNVFASAFARCFPLEMMKGMLFQENKRKDTLCKNSYKTPQGWFMSLTRDHKFCF